MALSFSQLEGVWIAAGGDAAKAPLMAAIALAESSGDPNATNPTDNNGRQTSWGLWQISTGDHDEPDPNWADPVTNARLAVAKLRNRSGLRNWGTYTDGSYRKYLETGVDPTTPSGGSAPSGGGAGVGGGGQRLSQADYQQLLGGWLGPLISSLGGSDPALAGVVGTTLGPISNTFKDFGQALSTAMHAILWLVNPMNWVRIIAGVVGVASAVTGTVLLAKAV